MKKLIQGIIQFRETKRQDLADTFSTLALGQKPDALFIACSDSRVAVNIFASTDPGDLFVLRNVGNLVPPSGHSEGTGTAAAIDFAVENLRVKNIIVCGHSDCGAIHALRQGHHTLPQGPLKTWLELGATNESLEVDASEDSRRNVLAQIEHLKTYPNIQRAMLERHLGLHAIWFDIRHLDVFYFEQDPHRWTLLDAEQGERILAQLDPSF